MSKPANNLLEDGASLEEVRAFFADDRFATQACKARIVEARRGHAVCEFSIEHIHRNAMGAVMGGAVFTLADFALAVASNIGESPTVSVSNSIEFISAAKGDKLTAVCDAERSGRTLGFYTVRVHDDRGTLVAVMTATCYR